MSSKTITTLRSCTASALAVVAMLGAVPGYATLWSTVIPLVAFGVGCHGDHEHADEHGHGHGEGEAEDEGPEPLAITIWTEQHELFVEFPPPAPNQPVRYHAHVTRIRDNHAATEGRFTVQYLSGGKVMAETHIDGVARAGIFTPEGNAPAAGTYQVAMIYEVDGDKDTFDCGAVVVAETPPESADEGGGAISFLKESQWKIPFVTAWAKKRPMAKEIELAATIEPAASDQLTIGAATGGRFFHNPKVSLGEGLRIKSGDVVGTIAPTVAGDDFGRLQLAVEESTIAVEHARSEIARIKPLVDDGVLPQRRLIDLEHELNTHTIKLKSAGQRLGRVVSPDGAGGLVMKSTIDGVVAQVLVPNGEPVEPGTPLIRVAGSDHLWIRARFVARPGSELADAEPAAVRLPSGKRIVLADGKARFLSTLPVIDPASRIATWVVDAAASPTEADSGAEPSANLPVGSAAVLIVRIGKPQTVLAVPATAVIDINTRPYVFVQVDGESFDKRAVTLGSRDGDYVHILSGVDEGDRVVTEGGFDVHLASLMGAVESHRH